MNYRRRHNQRQQQESSFLRNWKFETPKETLGKLVEWAVGALGLIAGAEAARRGLSVAPTVASGAGAFLGLTLGAVAKAAVNAGFDTLKSRTPRRDVAPASGSGDSGRDHRPARLGWGRPKQRATRRGPLLGRRTRGQGASSGDASAGSVIAALEQIIVMMERNHHDLTGVVAGIRNNHAWLMTVLAGASPDLLQRISGQASGARRAVEEACTLLRLSKDDLTSYVRTIGTM